MAQWMLTPGPDGEATRIGDVFIRAKNGYNNANKLRYCLMSDPAIRIPKPAGCVVVESINGTDILQSGEMPELKALEKASVKGYITNADGSRAAGYVDRAAGTYRPDESCFRIQDKLFRTAYVVCVPSAERACRAVIESQVRIAE